MARLQYIIILLFILIGTYTFTINRDDYPNEWRTAEQDTILDNWGMANRECVSYTAWKVYKTFHYEPIQLEDAKYWPSVAKFYKIPTGTIPKVHSVAISPLGRYGHSMWVEAVNRDGTIIVSQYNQKSDGKFSLSVRSTEGLTFIYF